MSKNGFFHTNPLAYDIAVSPEMEQVIGNRHVAVGTHNYNGRVSNVRYSITACIAQVVGIVFNQKSERKQ